MLLSPMMTAKAENNDDILYLDSEASIVLPYFDTSSIGKSDIDSIILNLFVLKKSPTVPTELEFIVSPIDLNNNTVGNGASLKAYVKEGEYVSLDLPIELFEESVQSPKRFLLRLLSRDQRLVLQGVMGTVQDPKLIVEHNDIQQDVAKNKEFGNSRNIIINNTYNNINNSQIHLENGDNVMGQKKENSDSSSRSWLATLAAVATIIGLIWAVFSYFHPKNNIVSQSHYGQGDNVGGDKLIK